MSRLFDSRKRFCTVITGIAALLLLSCFTNSALAQRSTASVAGSVTDESGATVPGAEVVARNLATGVERSVLSNDLGYYVISALVAGEYHGSGQRYGRNHSRRHAHFHTEYRDQ